MIKILWLVVSVFLIKITINDDTNIDNKIFNMSHLLFISIFNNLIHAIWYNNTVNSANVVPTAAPTIPSLGINKQLVNTLTIAPKISE